MLQKFLGVFLLSYSLIISSFAASTREIGFDVGTLKTQSTTPANPSSGKNKIYVKDGNLKLLDSTGSEKSIGSAESDNFISDPGAELVNTSCVTYADAAAILPVDGIGGVPNVTATNSTSSPLSGLRSLVFNKGASNSQGQGFSCDFTIDNASKGKVLRTQFDYEIASGTYASGDVKVWIYDITNSRLIEPSSYSIESSGLKETKFSEWQSSIDSTSYRLIYHITSTSANAYTLKFDSFKIGRGPKIYGSVSTDYVNVGSMTISATTTAPTKGTVAIDRIMFSRNGSRGLFKYQFKQTGSGSAGVGEYLFSLPSGMSFDTNIVTPYSGAMYSGTNGLAGSYVGSGQHGSASETSICKAFAYDSTKFRVMCYQNSASSTGSTTTAYHIGASSAGPLNVATVAYDWFIDAPIAGWSSSQQLSQDADTRVIATRVIRNASQTIPNNTWTKVTWASTPSFDKNGMWDSANNRLLIKQSGEFNIKASLLYLANATGGRHIAIYKNGVSISENRSGIASGTVGQSVSHSDILQLIAGDYLEIYTFQSSGGNLDIGSSSSENIWTIERISGPSQISASESVSARYTQNTNQSIPNSSTTTVVYPIKVWDSHNAYNSSTGVFTTPSSGEYLITASVGFNINTAGVRELYILDPSSNPVCIDASSWTLIGGQVPNFKCTMRIKLLAGQTVSVATYQTSGGALSLHGSVARNFIEITKVGNY